MSEDCGVRLDLDSCRKRQLRFASELQNQNIDLAILCRTEHVQYFTGFRPAPVLNAAVVIDADGDTLLCAPNSVPDDICAKDVATFEAQWRCTLRQDQIPAAMAVVNRHISKHSRQITIGVEGGANPFFNMDQIPKLTSRFIDVDPLLFRLRRRKDADELRMIHRAIECSDAMYRKAREIIRPGITELDVYLQLHGAALSIAGEPLTAFGNDFQCCSPGGPPRKRPAQSGELFILDLGPAYRGYYADSCRTFLVDGTETDEQHKAWQAIVDVLRRIEETVRPGVSAKQLYLDIKETLDTVLSGGFFHHLGHGIGLSPHEAPHLNDHWDDLFEVGDVFTAEPGLYAPHLKAGIRIEEAFLVTDVGVERLTSFPLEL